jgi:hypothetical protein
MPRTVSMITFLTLVATCSSRADECFCLSHADHPGRPPISTRPLTTALR